MLVWAENSRRKERGLAILENECLFAISKTAINRKWNKLHWPLVKSQYIKNCGGGSDIV